MRTLTFVLALLITDATYTQSGGIYLNTDQFRHHSLSYPFDCQSPSDKLELNNFLGGSSIQVIHQGEKHSLLKDQIFGYRDCNGIDYRFYNKSPYRILDTAQFYLYSLNKLVQGSKIARPATVYYFSTDASAPLLPLTIANLETAFAANQSFIYKLHSDFRSDADLITYIPSLKTYKLKYAHAQSSK